MGFSSADLFDDLPPLGLILGGAASGKSQFAETWLDRAAAKSGAARLYVATAQADDAEMAAKIARHRARRGPDWRTIEAPLDLAGTLRGIARPDSAILVDCLTLWLSNHLLMESDLDCEIADLAVALRECSGSVLVVANELGLGIVPENALARRFREAAGRLNQAVAEIAQRVVFVAAGLPLILKSERSQERRDS